MLVGTFRELSGGFRETFVVLGDLLGALMDLGLTVLDVVGPRLSDLVTGTANLIERFGDLSDSTQRLGVQFGLVIGPAVTLATILGGPLGVAVGGLVLSFSLFRDELTALASTIQTQAIAALEGLKDFLENIGISRVVDALSGLGDEYEETFGIVQGIGSEVLGELQELFSQNEDAITRFGRVATRGISGFIRVLTRLRSVANFVLRTVVGPILVDIIDLIGNRLGPVLDSLSGLFTEVFDALSVAATQGSALWSQFGSEITATARFAADVLGGAIITNLDLLLTTIEVIAQVLQGDFAGAWESITGLVSRTTTRIAEILTDWGIIETINSIVDSIQASIVTFFTVTLPQQTVIGLGLVLGAVNNVTAQMFNSFIGMFNSLSQFANEAFTSVGNIIISQMNAAVSEFEQLINNVVTSLPSEVRDRLDIGTVSISDVDTINPQAETFSQDTRTVEQRSQDTVQDLAATLQLDTEGSEGPLAEFFRQNAEVVVEDRERRTTRQTGGRNSP